MGALKALVVGMGVLIVAGTVTLVVLLIQRAGGPARGAADVTANLPDGNRIMGIAGVENRLAIWLEGPEGGRVLLLDGRGRQVGELRAR
jgi:cell division protein FtsI/penicillin-binding protein 2